jgi:hypothetical protein
VSISLQFVKQQQQQQAPRPQQAYNFAPVPVVEKRKPVIQQAPAQQQYYDYDEEVIAPTAKPVQPAPRPKFQQQPQFAPSPPRSQFANAVPQDIIYADARQQQQQPQYENAFESRQPQQFPGQEVRATAAPSFRPEGFPLFSPAADSRADIFKPKVSKVRIIYPRHAHRHGKLQRKRKKKNVFFVVRKKRRYTY